MTIVKKKYKSSYKRKSVLIDWKVNKKKERDAEISKINGYLSKPFNFVDNVLITNSEEVRKAYKKINHGR